MKAKLIIEVRDDGKVYATGPLHDKRLCIAMLEEAMNIVKTFKPGMIVTPKEKTIEDINKTKT